VAHRARSRAAVPAAVEQDYPEGLMMKLGKAKRAG
jgi:hypothetical protein